MVSTMTHQSSSAAEGIDLASAFDREPGTASGCCEGQSCEGQSSDVNPQLSIQQLVSHLSYSALRVHDKIGVQDIPAGKALQEQPEPSMPPSTVPLSAPQEAPSPPVNPVKLGLHESFGAAMTSAVSQAMTAGRFNAVRDSLTGVQVDTLMHPPTRPHAEPKNILTVRPCPYHLSTVSCVDTWSGNRLHDHVH